jgi:hypothetical protein
MALPIAATPVLTGSDADKFTKTVDQDLKKPAHLIATPKLEQGLGLVRKYAAERKKSTNCR